VNLHGASLACAAVVLLVGCTPTRTEYQYRPGYMTDPNAPTEMTLADGTRVVFVDTPMGPSVIDRDRVKNDKPRPVKLDAEGKPIPVRQFEPRETEDDGRVVLRNFTADHVVANTMACMRNEEYQLIWDQLLAPETRDAYDALGGYPRFEEWCVANRRSTMELLNRMRFNAMGSDVVLDKVGENRMRARVSPHLWAQFKLRVIEFRYTDDGMKLVTIRPE
jgi:hypothetical protein